MAEALALLREEQELEAEDARVVCDPSISVADLEKTLEELFTVIGFRNLQPILDAIRDAKCTWKTSPKAGAWDLM